MSDRRLNDTLNALRTDVDHLPLADSSAVRARGTQRTRRQAVGASLAVVALVAGAVGISGALTGNNNAEERLPAEPTVNTKVAIGPELLLAVEDLPAVYPQQTYFLHETLVGNGSAAASQRDLTVCGQPPAGGTSPERTLLRTFPITGHFGSMWQWVAQYADAEAAQQAFTQLESGCPVKNGSKQPLANGLPGGATGFQTSIYMAQPDREPFAEITSVVRHGDAVVVLEISASSMIKELINLNRFDAAVIVATERIASRSVAVPDPTVETRKPIGESKAVLLGVKELPTFPNQPFSAGDTFVQATTADAEQLGLIVCGTPPDGGVTADSATLRTFGTDLDIRMWQWVAQYANVTEAEAAVAALSSACAGKGATPVDISKTATMPGVHAAVRSSQFSADPGSDFNASVTGIVRQGDVVVVLGLNGMLRETEVDMDAFDAAVASAAQRLSTI
jgi:hypothetical protein